MVEMNSGVSMYVQQPARPGWGSNNLTTWGEGFSFQHFSCAFLRTYMLVHCCKSNVIFELSFQFVWMNSHGSLNVVLPSSPWVIHSGVQLTRLICLLWPSIRLFYCLRFCLSSFIPHLWLITFLENNMALVAETSSLYTTLRLLYAGWSSNAYQPNICGCRLPPL